jgi:hypothetical protein
MADFRRRRYRLSLARQVGNTGLIAGMSPLARSQQRRNIVMKARLLIVTLSAASLLSFSAFAGNTKNVAQFGFLNSNNSLQVSAFGSNSINSLQVGAFNQNNAAQIAGPFGSNSSNSAQFGIGNSNNTVQVAL